MGKPTFDGFYLFLGIVTNEIYTCSIRDFMYSHSLTVFCRLFRLETIFIPHRQDQKPLHPPIFEEIASFQILILTSLCPSSQTSFFSSSLWLSLHRTSILYYNVFLEYRPGSDLFHHHVESR